MKKYLIAIVSLTLGGCAVEPYCIESGPECTRYCPNGDPANAEPPYCRINDRDLLPPSNDNIGVKALPKNKEKKKD